MSDSQLEMMLEKARRYCLRGEKCKYDLRQKLYQWQVPDELHDKIIRQVEEERFIDEQRYAQSYANDKCYLSKWGKVKIRFMLSGKQIPEEILRVALDEIDMNRYREVLKDLAESKQRQLEKKEEDPWKTRQKLFAYLSQRGFESDEISKILPAD